MDIRLPDEDFVADRCIGNDPLLAEILQSPFGDMQRLANLLLCQSLVGLVRSAQRTQRVHALAYAVKQGAQFVVNSRFDHFTFHN